MSEESKEYPTMILMRGLPGSGKSYDAKFLAERAPEQTVILSTDDFFTIGEKYCWDVTMAGMAHAWNLWRCRKVMMTEMFTTVIIDNTNTRGWEMMPYLALAELFAWQVDVRVASAPWRDDPEECFKHCTKPGITLEKIIEMRERFD